MQKTQTGFVQWLLKSLDGFNEQVGSIFQVDRLFLKTYFDSIRIRPQKANCSVFIQVLVPTLMRLAQTYNDTVPFNLSFILKIIVKQKSVNCVSASKSFFWNSSSLFNRQSGRYQLFFSDCGKIEICKHAFSSLTSFQSFTYFTY